MCFFVIDGGFYFLKKYFPETRATNFRNSHRYRSSLRARRRVLRAVRRAVRVTL